MSCTDKELEDFNRDGFVITRNLLTKDELAKLQQHVEKSRAIDHHNYGRDDGEGGRTRTALWNNPADDVTGVIARAEKVAGRMEKLLGGEVYHYHAKLIMKDARTGGAHVWHQDYGYWYENGCLFPDMGTVWIAVDKADKANGCLKILRGSHRAGRIDHKRVGDQAGADLERVEELSEVLELVHLELEAGDACFFHSNLLHRSDQNRSDRRRWAYLVAYNRRSNNPTRAANHPQYTPLHKVPDSAIMESGEGEQADTSSMDFFAGPKADTSLNRITENLDSTSVQASA